MTAAMEIDLLTLFPEICLPYLNTSILGRAQTAGRLTLRVHNIRDYAQDRHRSVDDAPYGGGVGMVMTAPVLVAALDSLPAQPPPTVIMLRPQGQRFDQQMAVELSRLPRLVLICGRYEGVDQRVLDLRVEREISLGDFVLTGGELAALSVIDACVRLLPGALGGASSASQDSFSQGLLEYPHYTRPREFMGLTPPAVLLSGNHQQIALWRRQQSLLLTSQRRPDLLRQLELSDQDKDFLKNINHYSFKT
jgi:tRNA (guanine37-N1)-methyltransferase